MPCLHHPLRLFVLALAISVCSVALPALRAQEPKFVAHCVDAGAEFHSCAVLDINADGVRDIVTGGFWYEGPAWKKHLIRRVEQIRGRYDDYSCLPLDVNGDGFTDLVSTNYRSESIYWVQNPGPEQAVKEGAAEWSMHVVDRPGPMETGRLNDVDGDGRLDVLPNGVKFAAWWDVQPGSQPAWTRYALPEELGAHGVGFGDINGDGRGDVVGRFGWAEAPEDRRNSRWVFHPEFQMERDASIPMVVHDADQDGDNDIIWGRGHRIGLYWMEQQHDDVGGRLWKRHAIDTSWSQPHSLLQADVDGDGHTDLIAGKRFLGHDGKDQGEYDPLVSYWYRFQPTTRTWFRSAINVADSVGYGLDPRAEDLDGDGDVDLVVADRSGVFWLENRRLAVDADSAAPQSPEGSPTRPGADTTIADAPYDHRQTLFVRGSDGMLQPVTTPFQMGLRRQHILDGMALAMGPVPGPEQRVPLDFRVISETDAGKYVRKRITYGSEPGDRVPAWLLIPKGIENRTAAMLCLHQTTTVGKGEPAGLGGLPSLHYAHELAERGFVCLVPDYPSFGDYSWDFRTQGKHYASGSMKAIWNNMRAVDLLETLPEVDSDRIGCIGHSLGGHNTLFTAAHDQRLRAVVTSCGFTAFHNYYGGKLAGWTSDRYMPRIRDVYDNSPDRVPFDFHEVLAAIAPRAVFVNAPLSDSNFEVGGVRSVVAEAAQVYPLYAAPEGRLVARYPDCGHDFPAEVRAEAYDWLREQLK